MADEIEVKRPAPMTVVEQEIAQEARDDAAMFQQGVARINHKSGHLTIDGAPVKDNKITVAIIASVFGKAYYPRAFSEGEAQTPTCYGFHPNDQSKIVPHPEAPDKQAPACLGCHWNKFGTSDRGKGKKCKDEIRLMVVAPTGQDFGAAEVRLITVPPGSLKNFGKYVNRLTDMGASIRSVLTEIGIQPYKGAYQLTFTPVSRLTEEQFLGLKARRDSAIEQAMQPYPVLGENEEPEEEPPARKARRAAKLD